MGKKADLRRVIDALETQAAESRLRTHQIARNVYARARKANPSGKASEWRHSAAHDLELPYDEYMRLWHKPKDPSGG